MQPQTLAFIGPPGSGKGTQAKRLAEFLEGRSDSGVLYLETGAVFRRLAESDTETGHRVKESMEAGDIEPAFLSTMLWTEILIENLSVDNHLVIDGSPRSLLEAGTLDEALQFYRRTPTTVIHLTLSEATTYERLEERGRGDDHKQTIAHRLEEYRKKTVPVIDFYRQSDNYRLVEIDGEQSIEEIQQEIRQEVTE